ncbi:MAG: cation diffusion facilitator family transporter [Candidatus Thorarchaeota archaeon]
MQKRKEMLVEGERATFISMISNIFLILFKISAGAIIGSLALIASGFDALTDLIASFAVFLGLRFSQKDPSKRFPYGYYRLETLATLIVSIFILIVGINIIIESTHIIITPSSLNQPILGLLVSAISILIAFGLYRYNFSIGTKIMSNALISTAKEFQLDIFMNSLVFIGILGHLMSLPQLEGFIGWIMGLFIIKTGLVFGKNSLLSLLDALEDPQIIEQIESIIVQYPEVKKVINVRTRRSGPFFFADIVIQMLSSETVKSVARMTHKLESALRNAIPQLDSVMISIEPVMKTQYIVVIAVSSLDSTLDDPPAEHFGMAPAFLFVKIDRPTKTKISTKILENPHRLAERKRGILAANFLTEKNLDILAIKDLTSFGVGPKAVLSEKNVELFQYQGNSIEDILSEIITSQSEK